MCGFGELAKEALLATLVSVGSQGMTDPERPQLSPYQVELEAGKRYAWCRCGRSKKQPFCDGSHKGSEFSPEKFSVTEAQKVWLCGCKQTASRPFCDGSHKKLA